MSNQVNAYNNTTTSLEPVKYDVPSQVPAESTELSPAGLPRSTPLPQNLAMAMNPRMDFITHHILPRSQVRSGAETSYGDPTRLSDETVDRYYDIIRREGNRAALGATLRASIYDDDPNAFNRIATPTLILWGAKDTFIPAKPDAEEFHRRIAGSTLIVLPDDGHVAQEEDPDGTVAAFEQWLGHP